MTDEKKTVKLHEDDWKWLQSKKLDNDDSSLAETFSKIRESHEEKNEFESEDSSTR